MPRSIPQLAFWSYPLAAVGLWLAHWVLAALRGESMTPELQLSAGWAVGPFLLGLPAYFLTVAALEARLAVLPRRRAHVAAAFWTGLTPPLVLASLWAVSILPPQIRDGAVGGTLFVASFFGVPALAVPVGYWLARRPRVPLSRAAG
jgi:hypothetical protein